MRHIIVVGGGASGLVAAITAAREGASVTLIEQKDRVGKKILSTGNGKCNLTNEEMNISCFRGDDTSIVEEVLQQFDQHKAKAFFEEMGVLLHDRKGYVYPFSDQASTILDVLRAEAESLSITPVLSQSVLSVTEKAQGFSVRTATQTFSCDAVILATGGKASSVLGSDGSGYTLAKSLGHHITPVVPALVQLVGNKPSLKQIAGIRTQANVCICVGGEMVASDSGELQLTEYGISGIPVFQISRFASKALYEKKQVTSQIDFLPQMDEKTLQEHLKKRLQLHGNKSAEAFLLGLFHKKLCVFLLKEAKIDLHTAANKVSEDDWMNFAKLCKCFRLKIVDTKGFDSAQVCAGGVKTREINPVTMESLCTKDLYLCGELMDIDGICGGYNLQWAWATGYIAGKNAAKGRSV